MKKYFIRLIMNFQQPSIRYFFVFIILASCFLPGKINAQIGLPTSPTPANGATVGTKKTIELKWTNPAYTAKRTITISDDPSFPAGTNTLVKTKDPASVGADSETFDLSSLGEMTSGKIYYWKVEVWCSQNTYSYAVWNFKNVMDGMIKGRKIKDEDGNGILEETEQGLEGWTIKLSNGLTTTTDKNGNYSFSVPGGSYTVSEEHQWGWIQTYPDTGFFNIYLEPGQIVEGINFGNALVDSIQGQKYFDRNGDGFQDKDEPGMNGITIELYRNGKLFASQQTNYVDLNSDGDVDPAKEFGIFKFSNLPPGNYVLKEVKPSGFEQMQPDSVYKFSLPSQTSFVLLFGNWTNMDFDFGDLPDSLYITLLPWGACHADKGPMLGDKFDYESDGQPDFFAMGDDTTSFDEDGVEFIKFMPGNSGEVEVKITGAKEDFPCQLAAWIDFNGDHKFLLTEMIIYNEIKAAGTYKFNFNVPVNVEGIGYARFRLSTNALSVLFPFGPSPDGEVEDYVAYGFDYGDSPEIMDIEHPEFPFGYPTKFVHNGARHVATPTTKIGDALTDSDNDGLSNCFASGDDKNLRPDEDGIVFGDGFAKFENVNDPANPGSTYSYYQMDRGANATITPLASRIGLFNAWIDFNRDGDWSDDGEHVFIDERVNPAPNYTNLSFDVPVNASPGYTYARFRFSTQQNLSFTGPAKDGEVEDYLLSIDSLTVSVNDNDIIPVEFKLNQNYPNPFNPATIISYQLPAAGQVIIKVYNTIGKEIAALVNETIPAGYHQVEWKPNNSASGIYFYSIYAKTEKGKEFRAVNKMLLLK